MWINEIRRSLQTYPKQLDRRIKNTARGLLIVIPKMAYFPNDLICCRFKVDLFLSCGSVIMTVLGCMHIGRARIHSLEFN